MSWNFRRRIKIAPGVHINLSKRGVSTSIGPRGASLTFGPNGTYLNTSIPGTGLYKRRKLFSSSTSSNSSSITNQTNGVKNANNPSNLSWGCASLIIFCIFFNLIFIFGWLGDFYLWESMDNPFMIFFLVNLVLIVLGVIISDTNKNADKNDLKFSYKQEKDNAQSTLDSLSVDDTYAKDILKAYLQCLTINEEHDKEQEILEEMKKSTKQKVLDLIPVHEAKVEALKDAIKKVQYDADAGLSEEQKQAFQDFSDSFETLCESDQILFESGVNERGAITKEETKFEFGIFDYIKSGFDIPVMVIPKSSTKFYIYPRFIIRSESTTNFAVYPIEEINIDYNIVQLRDEKRTSTPGPQDATIISSNYLFETKNGEPDRRYSFNPMFITYEFGRLMIPKFTFTRELTFYISNNNSAKEMHESYQQYVALLKRDNIAPTKKEVTNEEPQHKESDKQNQPANNKLDIDFSRIDRPDPLLLDVIEYVVSEQVGAVASIQRKFEIGFHRAGKIVEQLITLGIYESNGEKAEYNVLIKSLSELQNAVKKETKSSSTKSTRSRGTSYMKELDALVGLALVKEEIKTLSNFIRIQQKRKEEGLKSSSVSYHCVFTGNPGTGKTTVARIVAQIYKDLGILSKGHLVETDRAGLVAEYVGQTAVKTNKIIDSALDGVLFIDEAYSLIGTGQDYGKEAIATLLKRMEDNRDRLVVILAGYSKEMQDFINTNPGLQSRFNRYIDFPDYSAEELLEIFEKNVEKFDYKLEKEALVAMSEYFQHAVENKDANFGNARFVRNIFEKTLEKQANRLSTDPDLDKDELTLIIKEDIPISEM